MDFDKLLKNAIDQGASDLHITVGTPPVIRKFGELVKVSDDSCTSPDIDKIVRKILTDDQFDLLQANGNIDYSFSLSGVGRFRINIFRQRGSFCIIARHVSFEIPTIEELGLPGQVKDICNLKKGLILIAGPTASGKSTTLAAIINLLNQEKSMHILTVEDPVEYIHKHNKSIINQREIGSDCKSYKEALKAALREDPDVIMIGEMRDAETVSLALTAAETGHLVLSSININGCSKTIERIIEMFPEHKQVQIREQLSSVLYAIISQQLIHRSDKSGRVACFEMMMANAVIRDFIRQSKINQIDSIIKAGTKCGMQAMDSNLADLYKSGIISYEDTLYHSSSEDNISRLIKQTEM